MLPSGQEGDDALDRHYGSCFLRDARCARVVADTLLHNDGESYALHAWCVMPNHVHVLLATPGDAELGAIVRARKTFSARRINATLARRGPVWARDYFDRYIRNDAHYENNKRYIEMNPVAAGLCDTPEAWPYSSAGWKGR